MLSIKNISVRRFMLLIIGSILMGIGVNLANSTSFGADSIAVLWSGMVKTFNISLGTANNIFNGVLLLFLFIKDKKYIGIGTILSPLIQSITMDTLSLIPTSFSNVYIEILIMLIGIVILSIGCGVYASARLGLGAFIGIVMMLSENLDKSVSLIKFSADLIALFLAIILGVMPSIGPIVNVFISGPIMQKTIAQMEYKQY